MPKAEYEFFNHDGVSWTPVAAGTGAAAEGMVEKILNWDEEAGVSTRMLKFPPGVETSEVIFHDFWEEVFISGGRVTRQVDKYHLQQRNVRLPSSRDAPWPLHFTHRLHHI